MLDPALLDDLERTLPAGSEEEREIMLSRIADLFVAGADQYSPDQINLFDELLTKLISVVETTARARLANRLAALPQAPAGTMRTLAFDDDIAVAGPALREAEQLNDSDLVKNATTKSQDHLIAIAERKSLSETVTDALVTRGGQEVVHSLAGNAGASFSYLGFNLLVRRSSDDAALAVLVGSRSDLPRKHLLRLLDAASAEVRARLSAQNPESVGAVNKAVAEADASIRDEIRSTALGYAAARSRLESLHRAGKLNEQSLVEFAHQRKIEETAAALSLLCEVDIGIVEHALVSQGHDIILILVKIAGFSWTTAKAILLLQTSGRGMSSHDLDKAMTTFSRLNVGTARQVLDFYSKRSKPATGR